MTHSTNRQALASLMPETSIVELGEGRSVRIRALSGAGRAQYLKLYQEAQKDGGMRPSQVAALAMVEDDGSPSFDASKPEDLAFLDSLSGAALDDIAVAFYKLSGLTGKAVDDAKGN